MYYTVKVEQNLNTYDFVSDTKCIAKIHILYSLQQYR